MDSAVQGSWLNEQVEMVGNDQKHSASFAIVDNNSRTSSVDIEALEQFSAISQQFIDSYNHLNDQVQVLRQDLAAQTAEKELKALESELQAQRLQAVLGTLPNGVVVIDGHGVVQQANSVAIDMLGEPLEGVAWIDIISRAFSPRSDDGHEISLIDGRRVKVDTQAIGTQPGQVVTLTDLTETRRQQETFSREQRLTAIGRMMASLAHQIRTPLSSALLYSGNLVSSKISENKRQEFHKHMTKSLKQLEHNISDMLLFASGGNAKSERYFIKDLLNNIEHNVVNNIFSNFDIELNISNQLDVKDCLYGNQQALCGAIGNLIENSIHACRKNNDAGKLTSISLDIELDDQNELCIIVSDNGPGIAPERKELIFEPFHTGKSQGTGLGLAVVKTVVNNYKGRIDVTSELQQGTQFIVRLPIIKQTTSILQTNSTSEVSDQR